MTVQTGGDQSVFADIKKNCNNPNVQARQQ